MDLGDAGLVQASRNGDREAFALLVGRHRPRVVDLARVMLGDVAEAEDVAQEATYQAFFELAMLREPTRFGAWLCGIAVNLAKMAVRRRRFVFSLGELTGGRYLPGLALPAANAPELAYEQTELREHVQAALNLLPPEMRAAVWFHYVEGLSYQEVSAITGIARGTLRVLSHRARTRLREALAADFQPRVERRKQAVIEVSVHDLRVRMAKPRAEGQEAKEEKPDEASSRASVFEALNVAYIVSSRTSLQTAPLQSGSGQLKAKPWQCSLQALCRRGLRPTRS